MRMIFDARLGTRLPGKVWRVARVLWAHVLLGLLWPTTEFIQGNSPAEHAIKMENGVGADTSTTMRRRGSGSEEGDAACDDQDTLLFISAALLDYDSFDTCATMPKLAMCQTSLGLLCPETCRLCAMQNRTIYRTANELNNAVVPASRALPYCITQNCSYALSKCIMESSSRCMAQIELIFSGADASMFVPITAGSPTNSTDAQLMQCTLDVCAHALGGFTGGLVPAMLGATGSLPNSSNHTATLPNQTKATTGTGTPLTSGGYDQLNLLNANEVYQTCIAKECSRQIHQCAMVKLCSENVPFIFSARTGQYPFLWRIRLVYALRPTMCMAPNSQLPV